MSGRERGIMTKPGRHVEEKGATAARQWRALIPPITPGLILRALLGAFLFLCGIVLGVWLIIRFRLRSQDES